MAIFHCHVQPHSRASGHSAVGGIAYRTASSLVDERTQTLHPYGDGRKHGVLHTATILPDHAPARLQHVGTLWNEAERAEVKSNARVARDIVIALPHELDKFAQIALCRAMAQGLVHRYGTGVTFAMHAPDGNSKNTHVHLYMTTREITPEGLGAKTRTLDDKRQGPKEIIAIRQLCEQVTNRALERAGHAERVDHRSHKDRGLDREATQHLGKDATQLEQQGTPTRIGDKNREIQERNRERDDLDRQAKVIDLAIEREKRAPREAFTKAATDNRPREHRQAQPEIWDREQETMRQDERIIDAAIAHAQEAAARTPKAERQVRKQQEAPARLRQAQALKSQRQHERLEAWANGVRAATEARQGHERIDFDPVPNRQEKQRREQFEQTYTTALAETDARIAALHTRQSRGGFLYRFTQARKDRETLAGLAQTRATACQRLEEWQQGCQRSNERARTRMAHRHAAERARDEQRISAQWAKGVTPAQERKRALRTAQREKVQIGPAFTQEARPPLERRQGQERRQPLAQLREDHRRPSSSNPDHSPPPEATPERQRSGSGGRERPVPRDHDHDRSR